MELKSGFARLKTTAKPLEKPTKKLEMLDSSDDDPSSAIERSLKKAIKGGKKGSKVNKKKNIDDFDESDFDDKGS